MPPATVIGGGNNFTCAIADVVRCWGGNDVGQCGTGTVAPQPTAAPVAFASGYAATQLDVGDDHACAFAPGNAPQCWGHNDDGALGLGSLTPTQVLNPTSVTAVITSLPHIAGWHACALATGRVQCWGEGTSGELGDGMSTTNPMPVQVSGLGSVTALATGGGPVDHDASCAIGDGAVSCWGRGEFGRLGNGMAVSQPMPVAVLGLPARATSVAIGYGHACALLVDGDVWCWGRGDRGQLGDGMKTSSLAPVRVVRPSE